MPGAASDGNVGVIESGEFTFSQPGGEGQCYQGVVAYATALGGAQQTPLLVLCKRPTRVLRVHGDSRVPCVLAQCISSNLRPAGDVVSRNTPRSAHRSPGSGSVEEVEGAAVT
jgi:hypothetical protein